MENVRVVYIDPDKADELEKNPRDLSDEEFAQAGECYDLPTFQAMFNDEQISDLGYIRFYQLNV